MSWASNRQIRMISEASWDKEDWSNEYFSYNNCSCESLKKHFWGVCCLNVSSQSFFTFSSPHLHNEILYSFFILEVGYFSVRGCHSNESSHMINGGQFCVIWWTGHGICQFNTFIQKTTLKHYPEPTSIMKYVIIEISVYKESNG